MFLKLFLIAFCCFSVDGKVKFSCGRKHPTSGFIFGGEPAKPHDWPWLVALVFSPYKQFFCGGSLVSKNHVITAAHCFQSKSKSDIKPPQYIEAHIGKHDLSNKQEPGSAIYPVWQFFIHPDWDYLAYSFDADIAVVVLRNFVSFRDVTKVGIICLPQQSDRELSGNGTIVGWGKSQESEANNQPFDPIPNKLDLPIVSNQQCHKANESFVFSTSNRTFCAGYENKSKSACVGDSGTGFYFFNGKNNVYELVGIVSASLRDPNHLTRGCNVETFSIYTNVAEFRDWLLEKMEATQNIWWKNVEFQCSAGYFSGYHNCKHNFTGSISRNLKITQKYAQAYTVESLYINFKPSTHIFADIGKNFPKLKKLNIDDQNIIFVEREDFSGLNDLEELNLSKNRIEFLPENVFDDLENLKILNLKFNEISEIPSNVFSKLIKVLSINLSNNKLDYLPENLFKNNSKLESIDFAYNGIDYLPENTFWMLEDLKTLNLDGSKLPDIPENVFFNLKNLEELSLKKCSIENIPLNLFKDNVALKTVNLDYNPIPEIDWNSLQKSHPNISFSFRKIEGVAGV